MLFKIRFLVGKFLKRKQNGRHFDSVEQLLSVCLCICSLQLDPQVIACKSYGELEGGRGRLLYGCLVMDVICRSESSVRTIRPNLRFVRLLTYTVVLASLLKRESLISQKAFLLFAVFLVSPPQILSTDCSCSHF